MWTDQRPEAVHRCAVQLPIDAPLPDDLEWKVVDRYRDRVRWVDIVVIEGDNLPMHIAGEHMSEWRSFDQLRDAIAQALARAFVQPSQPSPDFAGGLPLGQATVSPWTGTVTMASNTASWTNTSGIGPSTTK